jgi:glycosyltransferase involved in cell wall biosynthesis
MLDKYSQTASYKGFLKLDKDGYKTLSQYDCMVFPTFFPGEGYPGAILDAFLCGLPVVASDWKNNDEIISEGKTGYLINLNINNSLGVVLENLIKKPEKLLSMRINCLNEIKKYDTNLILDRTFSIIKNHI